MTICICSKSAADPHACEDCPLRPVDWEPADDQKAGAS